MKIKSYTQTERETVKQIMGVYPEELTLRFWINSTYKQAHSEATKRGIAQAKLRRQAEQKRLSHE